MLFIVSALLLTPLRGVARRAEPSGGTLLSDTRAGAVVVVADTMNVAELVLAQREPGAGSSGRPYIRK